MLKKWIADRKNERTTLDGAILIALGVLVLFAVNLAKIGAGAAIVYGAWTIYKKE